MMLTHHSVLESHLPCTLHFVQWQKTNFKQLAAMSTVERPLRTFNRHSTALTKVRLYYLFVEFREVVKKRMNRAEILPKQNQNKRI